MGLIGQLNSTWGDFANQNLRPNNIYGPILSGSASWTQEKIEYKSFLEDMGSLFFQFPIDDSSEHFSSVFDSLVNLKEFYRKKISLLPQPFYRYLYKHPFIDSDSKPFLKQHEELSKKAGGCIEELEQLEKKAKDNGFYFQYLIFSAELAQLLAKKDDMRVFVNSNLGSLKKDEICRKIEKFKKKAQQIFTRYESLWLYAAKRPNLDFVLERFYNVIDFCDKKISELQKGIQFRDPLLPSHYIWDKKWSSKPKLRYFRKEINIGGKVKKAKAQLIGGNIARLFVNGQFVGEVKSRNSLSILPLKKAIQVFDITSLLKEGKNVLGIEANHYLRSIGSVNLYAQVSVLIPEGEGRTKEVVFQTNDTWKYCTDEKVSEKWATLDYSLKNAKVRWKNVKVVGTVPDINGDIYEPDLLKGEKSYASDIFGLAANIYYMVDLFVPTFLAKIIRFLSKPLFKLFK